MSHPKFPTPIWSEVPGAFCVLLFHGLSDPTLASGGTCVSPCGLGPRGHTRSLCTGGRLTRLQPARLQGRLPLRGPPPPLLLSGAGRVPGGGTPGDSCAYPHTIRLYGGFTPYHPVKSQHTFRPFLSFAIKHTGAVNIYVEFCSVPGGGGNIRPHR